MNRIHEMRSLNEVNIDHRFYERNFGRQSKIQVHIICDMKELFAKCKKSIYFHCLSIKLA